jgi:hypothetical protein
VTILQLWLNQTEGKPQLIAGTPREAGWGVESNARVLRTCS